MVFCAACVLVMTFSRGETKLRSTCSRKMTFAIFCLGHSDSDSVSSSPSRPNRKLCSIVAKRWIRLQNSAISSAQLHFCIRPTTKTLRRQTALSAPTTQRENPECFHLTSHYLQILHSEPGYPKRAEYGLQSKKTIPTATTY